MTPRGPTGNRACYTGALVGYKQCGLSFAPTEPKSAPAVCVTKRNMRQATERLPGTHLIELVPEGPREAREEAQLRDALKRCSPATREAALEFRRTGNVDYVPAIIDGLLERYVEPDARAKLNGSIDHLRLTEDLAVDSLTLLEIVFLAEEVLQISIDNEDLRPFHTVGDVKRFVTSKLSGRAA